MFSYLNMRRLLLNYRYIHNSKLVEKHKNSLGLWHLDINTEVKLKIEDRWSEEVVATSKLKEGVDTYYVLPMFPYPSGNLHMGHVRVYSISDTIARFHKLNGKNVIHPIGWDAFGLPAENAAIERNIHPHHWTQSNIDSMRQQLLNLKYNFDWERELSTCDPQYYKWTQYIFLKLFEKGLAYQCKAKVNWDPVDKTVLADEQVDEFGCSWRSGAKVESKILTQWFIKTTKYAKKLYDGLQSESLEDWKDIINLQQHWIGECNGVVVTFKIKIGNEYKSFDIWTSDPYKFTHGEFITMSNSNILLHGVNIDQTHLRCLNPITNVEMPIYVTDSVNYAPERDVYIAAPTLDDEDYKLAKDLNVPVAKRNNITFDKDKANQNAIEIAKKKNVGGHFVSSKLKDWLISRQRYWGTPIPIIHCTKCGPVPVPYEDLPVELPLVESLESGIQTLANLDDWVNCKCPSCKSNARRETDTMDTFVDSSWYYYRFLEPHNKEIPFAKNSLAGKTPVDVYIGGKEHAVLHLYYARFISYFLHSLGWTQTEEPFKKLVVQGMVMGQSYKLKSSGKYLHPSNVEKVGKKYVEKTTGEAVQVQWEKMSKSKHNGENPERLLSAYGSDTTKLLILADVPPATSRKWSDATLPGVLNWQHRLWLTIREFLNHRTSNLTKTMPDEDFKKYESKMFDARNYFIATATYHFKHTHKLSVGISRLQSLTSSLRNKVPPEVIAYSKEFELALASLIIMLSPVTPHFSSELWAGFLSAPNRVCTDLTNYIDWEKGVLDQKWPEVDDHYNLSLLCKVDGADRSDIKIKAMDLNNMDEETAVEMVISEESVAKWTKTGITRTKFELYPGCRAILHLYTNRQQKNKNEDDKKVEATN